jgi:Response regulators consisting of a CheY-like receiver domain and a winged-helix DNA-binding domain
MKTFIAIITDNILFSSLITTLIKRNLPDVETTQISQFNQVDDALYNHNFSLILIDGGMTHVSSIEMVQYLRMNKLVKSPIWFFPEIVADAYIRKANGIGVSKIISKPFDPYQVHDEIKTLLSSN